MFNPWLVLTFKAVQLGLEAQSVVALRMLRLASGGAHSQAELSLMVGEKIAAVAEAQVVTAAGCRPHVRSGRSRRRGESAQRFQKARACQQTPALSSVEY